MPKAVVKDGAVTPIFHQVKLLPSFLAAKFSPRNSPLAKSPPWYRAVSSKSGKQATPPPPTHLMHPTYITRPTELPNAT